MKVRERYDLQRLLRSQIEVLGEDLYVLTEEFGDRLAGWNLLSRPPHRKRSQRGRASGSEGGMVQKTRWENSSGDLSHFFDDDAVPGTVGVHSALLRKVEPFPTASDFKPYDPVYVLGWTVERYQVDLGQASEVSKQQMDATLCQLCSREVPGDTHRNLQIDSTYQDRTFKHIFVPVWLTTYTDGPKSFQVVVNGYTGKMVGEFPLSWVKILFAVLAVLVIILIIALLNQR